MRDILSEMESHHILKNHYPVGPFTILGTQDHEIVEFYVVQECRATDLEATNL